MNSNGGIFIADPTTGYMLKVHISTSKVLPNIIICSKLYLYVTCGSIVRLKSNRILSIDVVRIHAYIIH